jgi:hypothetical protein
MCTELLPPGGDPTAVNKYIEYQYQISVMCFLAQRVEVFISFDCQGCCTIFPKTWNFCWWFEEMRMKTEIQNYDWNVRSNISEYAVLVISTLAKCL